LVAGAALTPKCREMRVLTGSIAGFVAGKFFSGASSRSASVPTTGHAYPSAPRNGVLQGRPGRIVSTARPPSALIGEAVATWSAPIQDPSRSGCRRNPAGHAAPGGSVFSRCVVHQSVRLFKKFRDFEPVPLGSRGGIDGLWLGGGVATLADVTPSSRHTTICHYGAGNSLAAKELES
jgi:hypothetical protein